MPGIASCLDRHEWIKHGTCSGLDADCYFADTLRLAAAVQATPHSAEIIAANIGRERHARAAEQRLRGVRSAPGPAGR